MKFNVFKILWTERINILVSVLIFAAICAFSALFFVRGRNVMTEELRHRLRTIVSLGVNDIAAEDVDAIRGINDMKKPEYLKLLRKLNDIRSDDPDIKYVYIMRPIAEHTFEFVADADTLNLDIERDFNYDGIIDEQDAYTPPGMVYETSEYPYMMDGLEMTVTGEEPEEDLWGTFISGYAPIRRADGSVAGMLGVDIEVGKYISVANRIFSPVAFIVIVLAGMMITASLIYSTARHRLKSLQRIDEERKTLMLLASHQIGTPITIFNWALETLKEQVKMGNDIQKAIDEHIENQKEGIDHLKEILLKLRKATLVDADRITYQGQRHSLPEVIKKLVADNKGRLRRHNQKIVMKLEKNIHLNFDHDFIVSVMQELLSNAMVYSPPKSTITIYCRKKGRFAEVEVADPGCGIPKEDIPRLFEKFARAKNASVHSPNGTGLGLFIARGIVERAGGKIYIASELGKGTSVRFTLPL